MFDISPNLLFFIPTVALPTSKLACLCLCTAYRGHSQSNPIVLLSYWESLFQPPVYKVPWSHTMTSCRTILTVLKGNRPVLIYQDKTLWLHIKTELRLPGPQIQFLHSMTSWEHRRMRCNKKLRWQLKQQTSQEVYRTGRFHVFLSCLVGYGICGTQNTLDFQHQQMTTNSVEVGFCFIRNKVRI